MAFNDVASIFIGADVDPSRDLGHFGVHGDRKGLVYRVQPRFRPRDGDLL